MSSSDQWVSKLIRLDMELIDDIAEFRKAAWCSTESAAIRQLLRIGLGLEEHCELSDCSGWQDIIEETERAG